jgi:hypothetical protein
MKANPVGNLLLLSKDDARRIAANIVKMPGLLANRQDV